MKENLEAELRTQERIRVLERDNEVLQRELKVNSEVQALTSQKLKMAQEELEKMKQKIVMYE